MTIFNFEILGWLKKFMNWRIQFVNWNWKANFLKIVYEICNIPDWLWRKKSTQKETLFPMTEVSLNHFAKCMAKINQNKTKETTAWKHHPSSTKIKILLSAQIFFSKVPLNIKSFWKFYEVESKRANFNFGW